MRKLILPVLLFLMFILTACASNTVAVDSPDDTAENEAATPPPVVEATSTHQPGCTIKTSRPTPDATAQSVLPSVSTDDWTEGPSDAYVTIIEYGDFQ